jgi:hypothetical protein
VLFSPTSWAEACTPVPIRNKVAGRTELCRSLNGDVCTVVSATAHQPPAQPTVRPKTLLAIRSRPDVSCPLRQPLRW